MNQTETMLIGYAKIIDFPAEKKTPFLSIFKVHLDNRVLEPGPR